MSLKSFPKNCMDRKIIWCLSSETIDKAFNDPNAKKLMNMYNIIVIQLPISKFDKIRSPELAQLSDKGILKEDQILILNEDNSVESMEQKYLEINDFMENFLEYNLNQGQNYARFFGALGAKSIKFIHSSNNINKSKTVGGVELGGMVSKVTDVDLRFKNEIDRVISDMTDISHTFIIDHEIPMEKRYENAERIIKECKLEKDSICTSVLDMMKKDGIKLDDKRVKLITRSKDKNMMKAVLNLGLNISSNNIDSELTSIISFKNKVNNVGYLYRKMDLEIEIKF